MRAPPGTSPDRAPPAPADPRTRAAARLGPVGLAVLAALPLLAGTELGYGLGTSACIAVLLAVGYQITFGFCGQLSLAQGGLFGAGAYTAALLLTRTSATFGEAFVAAVAVAATAGAVVGLPCIRVRGDVLALVTLAAGEILQQLFLVSSVTGGYQGVPGIPPASVAGHRLASTGLYLLAASLAGAGLVAAVAVRHSVLGRAMLAVRDDPVTAAAVGIGARRVRLLGFVLGAGYAGAAGALFAVQDGYVSSVSFGLDQSVGVLLVAFLAGQGRLVRTVWVAAALGVIQIELGSYPRFATGFTGLLILAVLALRAHR